MRWQTTVVVAVLLLLVGGFYLLDVRYLGPRREKVEQEKNRVWSIEPKEIEELAIRREKDTVRLKRSGDGWQMVAPVSAPAAKGAVDDVVASLAGSRMDREVTASPGALAEFGLDRPAAEVALTVKGRKEPLRLALGAKSPTGAWVYAKKGDAPGVFVLSEALLRDATRPAADFRERALLSFDRAAVTAVRLVTPEDTIDLERGDSRAWRIARPRALPGDADVVSTFLEKLHDGRIKEFVADAPPSLRPYGLDRPFRVDVLIGKDKDRSTKTILFGGAAGDKQGVYAMRAGEPSVFLLDEGIWKAVPKNVAVLRDKTVVAFDRDRLTRIDLESAKGTVSLARDGEKWRITAPEALPGDTALVGGLLFQVREMKAQAFLPGVRFTPTVKVSLWEKDAKAPRVVSLGPSRESRGGQPSAYAEAAGQETVLVEGRLLAELSKSAADLRDHMLFGGLETKDVKRMRVRRGGQTAVLERSDGGGWRMVEPKRGPAKDTRVEDLLVSMSVLRWNEMLPPDGDPKRHGFDAPEMEVALLRADGSEMAVLAIGKREGHEYYVRTKAPAVYRVDTTRLGALPKVPDDFQG
jgi:hypothetical protein